MNVKANPKGLCLSNVFYSMIKHMESVFHMTSQTHGETIAGIVHVEIVQSGIVHVEIFIQISI